MNAKILYFDLETAPNLSYIWGHYEQNALDHVREWYIMCISYKWAHQKKAQALALPDFPDSYDKDMEDDKALVKKLWELIDEADIIIAHNGDKFDMRKANARFIANGLGPPSPVQQIDTLKMARKYFAFNSNRLGDLGAHLGLGAKAPTGGFSLWKGCMQGDERSWKQMKKYAKQDTVLLEQVYLALRPWARGHPSVNMLEGRLQSCPTCASGPLVKRGFRRTQVSIYQQYRCGNCGSFCRSRLSEGVESRPDFVS